MLSIKVLVVFVYLCFGTGKATGRRTPPKFMPVPRITLSVDDIRKEIINKVWTNTYGIVITIPGSRGGFNSNVRQLRIFYDLSADGKRLDRRLSLRTNTTGICILVEEALPLLPNRKMLGIWREPQDGFNADLRFVSRCPSKYYWQWICADESAVKRGVCRGSALLALYSSQDPLDQVPFEMAVKDLNEFGFKFTDPRFIYSFTGIACPI